MVHILTSSELMTLSCGVLFFLAFFVAMYVEVKAKNTVYQVMTSIGNNPVEPYENCTDLKKKI